MHKVKCFIWVVMEAVFWFSVWLISICISAAWKRLIVRYDPKDRRNYQDTMHVNLDTSEISGLDTNSNQGVTKTPQVPSIPVFFLFNQSDLEVIESLFNSLKKMGYNISKIPWGIDTKDFSSLPKTCVAFLFQKINARIDHDTLPKLAEALFHATGGE